MTLSRPLYLGFQHDDGSSFNLALLGEKVERDFYFLNGITTTRQNKLAELCSGLAWRIARCVSCIQRRETGCGRARPLQCSERCVRQRQTSRAGEQCFQARLGNAAASILRPETSKLQITVYSVNTSLRRACSV